MIEKRANTPENQAWRNSEEAAGSYLLINEKFIYKLTGEDAPVTESLRIISIEDFRKRFTDAELAAITTSNDPVITVALLKLNTKVDKVIDLDDPQVSAVVGRLVFLAIINNERALELLA